MASRAARIWRLDGEIVCRGLVGSVEDLSEGRHVICFGIKTSDGESAGRSIEHTVLVQEHDRDPELPDPGWGG